MKKETLEEAAVKYSNNFTEDEGKFAIEDFINGAKWQQERSYSEEDIKLAFNEGHNICRCVTDNTDEAKECFREWFGQFKKK